MHNIHGKKEFKLGTCSQVSIASSYISKVRSSNCYGFYPRCHLVDHVACKCYDSSHGNAMSHLVECHILSCGNSTSRHVEIIFSTKHFCILHMKYRVLTRMSMLIEMKLQLSSTVYIGLACIHMHTKILWYLLKWYE